MTLVRWRVSLAGLGTCGGAADVTVRHAGLRGRSSRRLRLQLVNVSRSRGTCTPSRAIIPAYDPGDFRPHTAYNNGLA